eukprot:scaffold137624_cov27-Tisochrysis_lutea.AAC.2
MRTLHGQARAARALLLSLCRSLSLPVSPSLPQWRAAWGEGQTENAPRALSRRNCRSFLLHNGRAEESLLSPPPCFPLSSLPLARLLSLFLYSYVFLLVIPLLSASLSTLALSVRRSRLGIVLASPFSSFYRVPFSSILWMAHARFLSSLVSLSPRERRRKTPALSPTTHPPSRCRIASSIKRPSLLYSLSSSSEGFATYLSICAALLSTPRSACSDDGKEAARS